MSLSHDAPHIFTEARSRAIDLGRWLSPEQAESAVAACPAWTVRDVFAHVTGIVDDFLQGRLEGLGSDDWTAAQLARRSGWTLGSICDEYEELGARFDPFAAANPDIGAAGGMLLPMRLTADLTVHMGDVAVALGLEPDRHSRAIRLTLARYGPAFIERVADAGLDPVRVEEIGPEDPMRFGPGGDGVLTLTATTYDLVRATTGRRSLAQISELAWSGDPTVHAPLMSAYGQPGTAGD